MRRMGVYGCVMEASEYIRMHTDDMYIYIYVLSICVSSLSTYIYYIYTLYIYYMCIHISIY